VSVEAASEMSESSRTVCGTETIKDPCVGISSREQAAHAVDEDKELRFPLRRNTLSGYTVYVAWKANGTLASLQVAPFRLLRRSFS